MIASMNDLMPQVLARIIVTALGLLGAWGIAVLIGRHFPAIESHAFALLATLWLFMNWINARRYFKLRRELRQP